MIHFIRNVLEFLQSDACQVLAWLMIILSCIAMAGFAAWLDMGVG